MLARAFEAAQDDVDPRVALVAPAARVDFGDACRHVVNGDDVVQVELGSSGGRGWSDEHQWQGEAGRHAWGVGFRGGQAEEELCAPVKEDLVFRIC